MEISPHTNFSAAHIEHWQGSLTTECDPGTER